MTKRKITHVLMIADMSGSMWPLVQDVRGGFNNYVAELRATPPGGDIRLTAVVFDTEIQQLCLDATLDKAPGLTEENYRPRGMTALLDAVGKTVTSFESRVKLRKPDRVLVIIQTDGEENSSREWSTGAVKQLIKAREETGQWGFIYLGQGLDTWAQADAMGIRRTQYINTNATSTGTHSTFGGLVGSTITYSGFGDIAMAATELREAPGVKKKDDL